MWNPENLKPISVERMRELDRSAIEIFNIPGLVLMENAGRSIAIEAMDLLEGGNRVHIAAGAGNNAGDGFVIARHLYNWGCEVTITLAVERGKFKGDCLANFLIVEKMEIPFAPYEQIKFQEELSAADLVVDALLGTGVSGALRPPFEKIVEGVNNSRKPVLAVDVPSGLDLNTGRPNPIAVRAEVTAACAAPKKALAAPSAKEYVGRLVPVYISLPRQIEPR